MSGMDDDGVLCVFCRGLADGSYRGWQPRGVAARLGLQVCDPPTDVPGECVHEWRLISESPGYRDRTKNEMVVAWREYRDLEYVTQLRALPPALTVKSGELACRWYCVRCRVFDETVVGG